MALDHEQHHHNSSDEPRPRIDERAFAGDTTAEEVALHLQVGSFHGVLLAGPRAKSVRDKLVGEFTRLQPRCVLNDTSLSPQDVVAMLHECGGNAKPVVFADLSTVVEKRDTSYLDFLELAMDDTVAVARVTAAAPASTRSTTFVLVYAPSQLRGNALTPEKVRTQLRNTRVTTDRFLQRLGAIHVAV